MKKKKSIARPWFNIKVFLILTGITLLVLLQGLFDYYIWQTSVDTDPTLVRTLVIEANNNLYRTAPRDAKTGDIYLPEARLRIPAMTGQSVLHYAYYPDAPEEKRDQEVYLSGTSWNQATVKLYSASENGRNTVSAFFEQVPLYQACSRQFLIKFSKTGASISTDYALLQKLELSDGRTAYLYTNQKCTITDNDFTTLYFTNLQAY